MHARTHTHTRTNTHIHIDTHAHTQNSIFDPVRLRGQQQREVQSFPQKNLFHTTLYE